MLSSAPGIRKRETMARGNCTPASPLRRGTHAAQHLSAHIGQIALPVADVDRSEAFYRDVLGLPKQYRFGDLTFFDCAGVRLLLEKSEGAWRRIS